MELVIVILAVLFMLGALLSGFAMLPLVLIALVVGLSGFVLVRLARGRRIRPR